MQFQIPRPGAPVKDQCVLAFPANELTAGMYTDEWGIERIGGKAVSHPMENFGMIELAGYQMPELPSVESCTLLAEAAGKARRTQKGAVIFDGGSTYAPAQELLGKEEFFIRLITDQVFMSELMIRLAQYHAARLTRILSYAGDQFDAIRLTDDFAADKDRPIRQLVFQSIFKPAQRMLVAQIKRMRPDVAVNYRCGAAAYALIPDFCEIRYDAWEPVGASEEQLEQISYYASEFGGRLRLPNLYPMTSYGERSS